MLTLPSSPSSLSLSFCSRFHSLLRPSLSAPVLSNRLNQSSHKLSLSSLQSIVCDELGLPLVSVQCWQ